MKKLQVSLFLLFSLLALNRSVEAQNPILPLNTFVPDVEAHVGVDGRMYIYGSWDNNLTSWGSNIQHVFSSADLINWTDHGEVFHSSGTHDDVPWTDALLYAPDAILNNGVTYMYFCLSDGSEGVAKSNSPAGPFTDAVKFNGLSAIDPAVIVDDDGQAYYYWGQFNSFGAKLKPNLTEIDMTSVKDSLITEKEHFFHEGSSMRKHNGIYYYVYASTVRKGRPTCLAYSTSTSPLGPFKYQGVIIDNAGCDPNTWNNHGSIAEFNGKWYVFYHRSSQGNQYNRRVCMEPISFNADGTIDEVPMTTQGAAEPLKANLIIEAERACFLQGKLYNRAISAKNEVLKGIRNNDAAAYKYINFDVPVDSFKISVFPGAKPVSLSITLDNSSVPIGEVLIPGNGDGNTSQTFTCKITATTGVHAVWLKVKGDADDLLKIDWFTFYQNSTCEIKKITPFLRVNGLDIEQISGKTLNVGDKVSLEPEALTNGIWSWSGPKKFSESTRIVTLNNIQRDQFGSYTATFTNDCGETSIQYFNVDFIGVEMLAGSIKMTFWNIE